MWKVFSGIVIVFSPIVILAYDFVAYLFGGNPSTISRIALDTAADYPSFKYVTCDLFGLLLAHLFAPRTGPGSSGILWLPVMGAVIAPLIVAFVNLALYLWPEVSHKMMMRGTEVKSSYYELIPVIAFTVIGMVVGFLTVAQHEGA